MFYRGILLLSSIFFQNVVALSSQSTSNNKNEFNPIKSISGKPSIQSQLRGKMILAPLTRGGNLPFRRLCADFGMEVSYSEMIYARSLLRGDAVEQARLRRSPNEKILGIQFATNNVEEGLKAIDLAAEAGADFADLNCGCPIFEATRRGLGSSLLRSPKKLSKLVHGLVRNKYGLPVTVKIRLGCELDSINCSEVVRTLREAGVSAVTVHGRTAQQGYSKPADWNLIKKVVHEGYEEGFGHIPTVGNGDILTYYEAKRRIQESNVDSVMVGRGALIKPWIFQEFKQQQTLDVSAEDRIQIYRTLTQYMKDHFGHDEWGRKKSWNFLPWHFEFFSRYTYHPEEQFEEISKEISLIQNNRRGTEILSSEMTPLELLLSNRSPDAHDLIAAELWESHSDSDAISRLNRLAKSTEIQDIIANGIAAKEKEDQVLTNLPKGKGTPGKWEKRRGRRPGKIRSEEEIALIRKQRAEKKARILAEGGVWPPP